MPNPENIVGKGRVFSSTYQPANRGRKKSVFAVLKEQVKATQPTVVV